MALSIKNCIVMSGLLLRSIALNLGIDAATARYLVNQWRPSSVEQGVTGGDEYSMLQRAMVDCEPLTEK